MRAALAALILTLGCGGPPPPPIRSAPPEPTTEEDLVLDYGEARDVPGGRLVFVGWGTPEASDSAEASFLFVGERAFELAEGDCAAAGGHAFELIEMPSGEPPDGRARLHRRALERTSIALTLDGAAAPLVLGARYTFEQATLVVDRAWMTRDTRGFEGTQRGDDEEQRVSGELGDEWTDVAWGRAAQVELLRDDALPCPGVQIRLRERTPPPIEPSPSLLDL